MYELFLKFLRYKVTGKSLEVHFQIAVITDKSPTLISSDKCREIVRPLHNVTLRIVGQVNTSFLCHITNHTIVFVIVIKGMKPEHLNRYDEKRECNSAALPLFVIHSALLYDLTGVTLCHR